MVDQELAEACRLQAEEAELGPALALLQKRGPLGATLVAVAQALGISQNRLHEPVAPTSVSHARALAHRLAEVKVQCRQQGIEPAIYFAPPKELPRHSQPKPLAAAANRASFVKPPAPEPVRVAAPKPPAAPQEPNPKPRLNLNVSLTVERNRTGQIIVSNVRLSGPDAANYEILAQPQDEANSADGLLRSLGIIVELERR